MTNKDGGAHRRYGWERAQYASEDRLRARIETHAHYSEQPGTWPGWVANLLSAPVAGPLLDAGCGNGAVFVAAAPPLASGPYVAVDLSIGMLRAARERAQASGLSVSAFVNADVLALPFPADTFAVAMANHMLYHVPDIGQAVAELQRVLQPRGLLIATTGSRSDYAELFALHSAAAASLGLKLDPVDGELSTMARFSLENGASYFTPCFANVELRTRPDALVFPDVDSVMRYYLSGPIYVGATGPEDPRVPPGGWDALADMVAEQVGRAIEQTGSFRTRKTAGAFLAHK